MKVACNHCKNLIRSPQYHYIKESYLCLSCGMGLQEEVQDLIHTYLSNKEPMTINLSMVNCEKEREA